MTPHAHLDDDDLQALAEHGSRPEAEPDCPRCAETVERYRILFEALARPAPPAPPGFLEAVSAAVDRERVAVPASRAALLKTALLAAACAVCLAAAFLADLPRTALASLPALAGDLADRIPLPGAPPWPGLREADALVGQVGDGCAGAFSALRNAAGRRLALGPPMLVLLAALGLLNALVLWFARTRPPRGRGFGPGSRPDRSTDPDPGPGRAGSDDGGSP